MHTELTIDQQGRIRVYQFHVSTESAIDAWAQDLDAVMANPPFYVLMDVSGETVNFSRYARQSSVELFTKHRQAAGALVMLFTGRTSPYFARIFFASLGKLGFQIHFTHQRETALRWLQAQQPPD